MPVRCGRSRAILIATAASSCFVAACGEGPAPDALDFVPPDAAVVGQADLATLGRSRLFRRIIEPLEAEHDIDDLGRSCGIDLVPSIDRVTFTMTAAGMSRLEFALVLEGRLDQERILGCALETADERHRPLIVESWSGARAFRSGGGGRGIVALVPSGPVLVGERSLVRRMLRQAASREPSIRRDRAVTSLLGKLGTAVRLVLRPPPELREQARRRLVSALRPLAEAELVAAGVSLGSDLALTAIARLPDPATARRLARDARRQTDAIADDPVIAATPFAGPIESLEIRASGRDVVVGARSSEQELDGIGSELDALVGRARAQ